MSEAISVSYTTFQDPTFPAGLGFPSEAAFLGSEIPFSQKPFLYFTQPFNITDLPLKLLSSEMKSHFLRTRSVFHTTFQDPTFPWQLELSAFLFLRHFWTSGFSLWKLESCGDSTQNQESFFFREFFCSNSRLFVPPPPVPDPADGEWNVHPPADYPGSQEGNRERAWEEHPAE